MSANIFKPDDNSVVNIIPPEQQVARMRRKDISGRPFMIGKYDDSDIKPKNIIASSLSVMAFIVIMLGSLAIIIYLSFRTFKQTTLTPDCPVDSSGSNLPTSKFTEERTYAILPNQYPSQNTNPTVAPTVGSVSDALKTMDEKIKAIGLAYRKSNSDTCKPPGGQISDVTYITSYGFKPEPNDCFDIYYRL